MEKVPKVLIIDDSTSACLFMASALEKTGFQVITAPNGQEGLTKAFQERPNCLILDVILPGINGFELCRRLRAMDPQHHIPIILISSKNTPLDQRWGLRQGADRYLSKPFTQEALVQVVEDVLPKRPDPSVSMRPVSANRPSPLRRQSLPDVRRLIPHRIENDELMRLYSPSARRLYTAIDGRKNIETLCTITYLDLKEVYEALQILLARHSIELYSAEGRRVEVLPFFRNL
jgi:DNA-binding response OmpR family regulator